MYANAFSNRPTTRIRRLVRVDRRSRPHEPGVTGSAVRGAKLALLLLVLLLGACASLPDNTDRPVSTAIADTDDTNFGRTSASLLEERPGESGFIMLATGLDAFVGRAVLARGAEVSIDAQYYLFHNDLTGRLFLNELLQAADRGVRVRLLVDDMDLGGRDLGVAAINSHPNVEVRVFNPFIRESSRTLQLLTRFGTVTRRMHNKSFTVDNQITVVGGRNIGDEYFEANPDLEFADLDVIAVGPVAQQVSASFDDYWNNQLAYPISTLTKDDSNAADAADVRAAFDDYIAAQQDSDYMRALADSPLANALRSGEETWFWGRAELVHDSPDKISESRDRKDLHLATQLAPYFDAVEEELIIFSPYFVPGKQGVKFLTSLVDRGARVRILTNSLASTDVGVVHAGYAKYRKALLRGGVELYEVDKKLTREERKEKKGVSGSSKASLHAKSFVLDREQVFIGSLNLDPRSVVENTELGIVVASPELARAMAEAFDSNLSRIAFRLALEEDQNGVEQIVWYDDADGENATYTVDPYTSFWRRFGVGFIGLFPIESQI